MLSLLIMALGGVGILISIAWIVNPNEAWWTLVAWVFRDPLNVEPSNGGLVLCRICGILGLVFTGWLSMVTLVAFLAV